MMADMRRILSEGKPKLLTTKFYVLAINAWCVTPFNEAYPAEVALTEFSLQVSIGEHTPQ